MPPTDINIGEDTGIVKVGEKVVEYGEPISYIPNVAGGEPVVQDRSPADNDQNLNLPVMADVQVAALRLPSNEYPDCPRDTVVLPTVIKNGDDIGIVVADEKDGEDGDPSMYIPNVADGEPVLQDRIPADNDPNLDLPVGAEVLVTGYLCKGQNLWNQQRVLGICAESTKGSWNLCDFSFC